VPKGVKKKPLNGEMTFYESIKRLKMYFLSIYKNNDLIMSKDISALKAISIGRYHLNNIPLQDPGVSRFHAAIFRDNEDDYFIQDLGSRNKTYVNKKRMDYGVIKDGDRIGIGNYILILEKLSDKSKPKKSSCVFIDEITNDEAKTIYMPVSIQNGEVQQLKDDAERLLLLYKLSRLANTDLDIEESLQLIVAELSNAFHPDKIIIALLEENGTKLNCLARFPEQGKDLKMSQTMIRYLLDNKQPIVTHDAISDERFKKEGYLAESILELQITSAICVPLKWGEEIRLSLKKKSTSRIYLIWEMPSLGLVLLQRTSSRL
jgi:hypothetical protein